MIEWQKKPIDRFTLDMTSCEDTKQLNIFKGVVIDNSAWPSIDDFPLFPTDREDWKNIMQRQIVLKYLASLEEK